MTIPVNVQPPTAARFPQRCGIIIRAIAITTVFAILTCGVGIAKPTPSHLPADDIVVLQTGSTRSFSYALVRDRSLHGHNTYFVAVGAHIGKLHVVAIREDGIVLSDGRELLAPLLGSVNPSPTTPKEETQP